MNTVHLTMMDWPAWMGPTPRVNCPWNPDEEALLKLRYHMSDSLEVLAHRHGRATGGIESRLFMLLGENFATRNDSAHHAFKDLQALRMDVARLGAKVNQAMFDLEAAVPDVRKRGSDPGR